MRIHVIGFGNLYQGDDGFGPHVCRELLAVPEVREADDVQVFDAGTTGLNALSLFEDCDLAIVIDAVGVSRAPGQVHRLTPGDVMPPAKGFSTHQMGPNHLLKVLPLALDNVPELVLFGAEINDVQPFSDQLTPPLKNAVVQTVDLVRHEIRRRHAR